MHKVATVKFEPVLLEKERNIARLLKLGEPNGCKRSSRQLCTENSGPGVAVMEPA